MALRSTVFLVRSGLVFLGLLLPGAPAQAKVYDGFNGTRISLVKWDVDRGSTLSQSGGLLHVNGPPVANHAFLFATHGFRGDFEFVLDFRNFRSTTTSFGRDIPAIKLYVADAFSDKNVILIGRFLDRGGHEFFSNAKLNGVWRTPATVRTSATSGLLRVARTGSRITTSYKEGATWSALQTYSAFSGTVEMSIGSYTGNNGTFRSDCDWITYRGQILAPPTRYGTPCKGPRATWDRWPTLGTKHFAVGVEGARPFAPVLMILGASDKKWLVLGLPLSLAFVGAPGCWLLASIDVLLAAGIADKDGMAQLPMAIPPNVSLVGVTFFVQWAAVDRAANRMGLAWSDGLAVRIQK